MALGDYYNILKEYAMNESIAHYFTASFFSGILALGIIFTVILALILYIYFALAWYNIARKVYYPRPWLAWIPFANLAMMLQLGRFRWGWVFLALVPVIGWLALLILLIISNWRTFENANHRGWYSLGIIVPQIGIILYLIAIGVVAWSDKSK